MVQDEAAVASVHGLCDGLTAGDGGVDQVEERLLGLGQVGNTGVPVVHLRVDVDGVLALPGRIEVVVPDALKVGG